MALVDFTETLVLPAAREQETKIRGYPEGSHINFVSWSDDSTHIAFTIRSPGKSLSSSCFAPFTLRSLANSRAVSLQDRKLVYSEQYSEGRSEKGRGIGGVGDPPRLPLELWVADVATGQSRRLLASPDQGLNCVFDK